MTEVTKRSHYLFYFFFFFLLFSLLKINHLQLYVYCSPVIIKYIFPILEILLDVSLLYWLTNVCLWIHNNFGHMYIIHMHAVIHALYV